MFPVKRYFLPLPFCCSLLKCSQTPLCVKTYTPPPIPGFCWCWRSKLSLTRFCGEGRGVESRLLEFSWSPFLPDSPQFSSHFDSAYYPSMSSGEELMLAARLVISIYVHYSSCPAAARLLVRRRAYVCGSRYCYRWYSYPAIRATATTGLSRHSAHSSVHARRGEKRRREVTECKKGGRK